MKSKLQFISTVGMSREDWLRYRLSGVGASDVGTILGLNPYKSVIQLFYEKAGNQVFDLENLAMFMGTEQQDFIAELWQYWDGSEAGMIANYRAGKIIRRCQRVNAYMRNPDYPWLFVSLDRKINKTATAGEGVLEVKRLGNYEAKKWEVEIVPSHVVQVQTQILVADVAFGELAAMKDGPAYEVYPFTLEQDICKSILKTTKDFWDRVLEARKVLTRQYDAAMNFNQREVQRCEAEMQKLEPEPDGTLAYADFLKVKYKIDDPSEQPGTDAQLEAARKHRQIGEQIAELETAKLKFENKLKRDMADKYTKLTFGDNGFISWKTDVNNVRRFLNKSRGPASK